VDPRVTAPQERAASLRVPHLLAPPRPQRDARASGRSVRRRAGQPEPDPAALGPPLVPQQNDTAVNHRQQEVEISATIEVKHASRAVAARGDERFSRLALTSLRMGLTAAARAGSRRATIDGTVILPGCAFP